MPQYPFKVRLKNLVFSEDFLSTYLYKCMIRVSDNLKNNSLTMGLKRDKYKCMSYANVDIVYLKGLEWNILLSVVLTDDCHASKM